MTQVVLVIHLLIALSLVVVILLQRSEGGGLGMGGGSGAGAGGMGGFLSGRGQANLLTRTTAILAACFVVTSLTLVHLTGGATKPRSIIEQAPSAPATPATPAPPQAQ